MWQVVRATGVAVVMVCMRVPQGFQCNCFIKAADSPSFEHLINVDVHAHLGHREKVLLYILTQSARARGEGGKSQRRGGGWGVGGGGGG